MVKRLPAGLGQTSSRASKQRLVGRGVDDPRADDVRHDEDDWVTSCKHFEAKGNRACTPR